MNRQAWIAGRRQRRKRRQRRAHTVHCNTGGHSAAAVHAHLAIHPANHHMQARAGGQRGIVRRCHHIRAAPLHMQRQLPV